MVGHTSTQTPQTPGSFYSGNSATVIRDTEDRYGTFHFDEHPCCWRIAHIQPVPGSALTIVAPPNVRATVTETRTP